MVLNNINSRQKNRGFTIVELLVVIVVIGILAAITIVSYTGITQKANTTKALTNAQAAQTVAEVYAADEGHYPATAAAFATGSDTTKLPAGITVVPGADTTPLSASNGATTVTWDCLTSCTNATGGRITYWDFENNTVHATIVYVGAATSAGTFVHPAS